MLLWFLSLIVLVVGFTTIRRGRLLRKRLPPLALVHAELYAMFAVFARICAEHGLQYWADAGTLLGTVRDGAIIAHDDDMDVCMYEEDIMHLKRALERDPVYEIALYDNWIWQMRKRGDPKEFWIDIFHMEDTEDRVQYKSARSRQMWPNGWYARTQLWPLRTMPFGDQDIFIPSLPEPYLTRMYGNWRIPVVWKRHGA